MPWFLLALFAVAQSVSVSAMDTAERVTHHAEARRILALKPILVETCGEVEIPYEEAVRIFASPTLLEDVQAEYARLLPPGEKPEFVIVQTAPGQFHYVNRHGQETWIFELHRGEHEGPTTEVVYYARGRRFFGNFEAIIHISAEPSKAGVAYRARVYAYPENAFSRFIARHLRIVHLFFHSKTNEIENLSVKIGRRLAERTRHWI